MERRHAYRLIDAADVTTQCRQLATKPATESQARPLTKLEPEQQVEAWKQVVPAQRTKPHIRTPEAGASEP